MAAVLSVTVLPLKILRSELLDRYQHPSVNCGYGWRLIASQCHRNRSRTLTEFLAENAAEVMAFEIDDRLFILAGYLCVIFDNVTVVKSRCPQSDLNQYIAEFGKTQTFRLWWLTFLTTLRLPSSCTWLNPRFLSKNLWSWCKRGSRPHLGWAQHQGLWFFIHCSPL